MADDVTIRIGMEVAGAVAELLNLRDKYIQFNKDWSSTTQQTARAINSLFGDEAKRNALTWFNTVDKLGGITKLTRDEQERYNKVLQDAIAKYKALGQEAPKAFQDAQRATHHALLGTQEYVEKSGNFFDRAFFRMTGAISLGDLAARAAVKTFDLMKDALVGIVTTVLELANQGSSVQNITRSFEGLSAGLGKFGGQILSETRVKTRGLISDFDIMSSASRAMLFGIDLNKVSFGDLSEAAIRLGRAMNIGPEKALSDLVLALGRVSPRILDNLGIIVKVREANELWAKANDRSVESMTAQERVLAFQEEAMRKIRAHLESIGPLELTWADRVRQMTVWWENFTNKLGLFISMNPVIAEAIFHISTLITQGFGPDKDALIKRIVESIASFVISMVDTAKMLVDWAQVAHETLGSFRALFAAIGTVTVTAFASIVSALSTMLDLAARIPGVGDKFKGLADTVWLAKNRLWEAQQAQVQLTKDAWAASNGVDKYSVGLKGASAWLEQLSNNLKRASKENIDYDAQLQIGIDRRRHSNELDEDGLENLRKAKTARETAADSLKKLNEALLSAQKQNVSVNEVVKEYGNQVLDAVAKSRVFGFEVPAAVQKIHRAVVDAKLDEIIKKSQDDMRAAQAKELSDFGDIMKKRAQEAAKGYAALIKVAQDASEEERKIGLTGHKKALEALDQKLAEERSKLGIIPEEYRRIYNAAVEAVKVEYASKQTDLEAGQAAELAVLEQITTDYGPKYHQAVEAIKAEYAQKTKALQAAHDKELSALGVIPDEYQEAYEAATDAVEAHAEKAKKALEKSNSVVGIITKNLKELPAVLAKAFVGGGGLMGGLSSVLTSVLDDLTAKLADTIKGIVEKMSPGLMQSVLKSFTSIPFLGAFVALGVAGVKALVGVFNKPEWKHAMKDVGRDYGVEINKGLAQEIAKLAETVEASSNNERRRIAELLSLDKIIEEGGGLTQGNLTKWEQKADALFAVISKGGKTGAMATAQLNGLMEQFGEHLRKNGGVADEHFRKLIDNAQKAGIELESINKFLDEQRTNLASGANAIVQGFVVPLNELADAAKKAKDDLDAGILGKAGQEEINRLTRANAAAADALAKGLLGAQEEFDRVSRLTFASINTLVASGKTIGEAIIANGPAIDALIASAQKLGLEGNDAFKAMARWRTLVKDNQELVNSIDGINQMMTAMANLGMLDEETFLDLQKQGLSTYSKLTAAGFTEKEARMQLAPVLEKVIKLSKEHGVAIDSETQALIDQAEADGVLRKEGMETNTILLEGFKAIIEAVGGKLPEAFKTWADKAVDNAARIKANAIASVTTGLGNVREELEDTPWREWADDAVDEVGRVRKAVDGVTYGSSPGGIKEWKIKLGEASSAFKSFGNEAGKVLKEISKDLVETAKKSSSLKPPTWVKTGDQKEAWEDLARELALLKASEDERERLELKFEKTDELRQLNENKKALGDAYGPLVAMLNEKYDIMMAQLIAEQRKRAAERAADEAEDATREAEKSSEMEMAQVSASQAFTAAAIPHDVTLKVEVYTDARKTGEAIVPLIPEILRELGLA